MCFRAQFRVTASPESPVSVVKTVVRIGRVFVRNPPAVLSTDRTPRTPLASSSVRARGPIGSSRSDDRSRTASRRRRRPSSHVASPAALPCRETRMDRGVRSLARKPDATLHRLALRGERSGVRHDDVAPPDEEPCLRISPQDAAKKVARRQCAPSRQSGRLITALAQTDATGASHVKARDPGRPNGCVNSFGKCTCRVNVTWSAHQSDSRQQRRGHTTRRR